MKLTSAQVSLLGDTISLEPKTGWFKVTNPADGSVLAYVKDGSAADTTAAITAADLAFAGWSGMTAKARSTLLKKWNDLVLSHLEDLALLVTLEQGRPIKETRGEVTYGASFIEWFAEEAKRAYGRTIPATTPGKHLQTIKQAVGVCAAITPWNFPISMITRKVSPALAAGCTVVIKPSEETPLSALALYVLARKAGLPDGVINIVNSTTARAVGEAMTSDPRVKKLSFTGSTPVGKLLYAQCAPTMKKISMELGGNAPFLVFDDADIDEAVEGALASKYRNTGQTCVCANRLLVQSGIYDSFAARLTERVKAMKLEAGWNESSQLGPLINQKAIDKVKGLVDDAVSKGAQVEVGGHVSGLFYEGTVLTGVTHDMEIFDTEIFGPVAPLFRFETEEEGIALANDTPFGLAAYAYTRDIGRAMRVAAKLEYGMVGMNDGLISTEVTPFGGVKESGLGREGAAEGLDEYLNIKYISYGGLGAI
ncbi:MULTISPECIES: NAD-dependent succinate-semialdehyde dehydrogenase [Asticcacaulis]|uniref:NAD-dependent succinate-semialdehyde dehydrogenase n=1 Tax=Asticcacaulis TaxID=76890 RepID=UPI001AE49B34|nr:MULTISPECIES: NAD-dependent succinate-semialdehyde dehydrogenase [Asticcacaulis]MBP2161441.1 succinate-semialdehyde dehydrogenase/glutarate-semialdehyde dehydrogenase [Asticcacaulis solisilvae]MDR6802486.1 succinate-semialdehyde dehydrogenase/glutarate-semialdehyde dehydrogenase [Asticcacaulis sp. BE141]